MIKFAAEVGVALNESISYPQFQYTQKCLYSCIHGVYDITEFINTAHVQILSIKDEYLFWK